MKSEENLVKFSGEVLEVCTRRWPMVVKPGIVPPVPPFPLVTSGTRATEWRSNGCRQRPSVHSGSEARRAPAAPPRTGASHPEATGQGSRGRGSAQRATVSLWEKPGSDRLPPPPRLAAYARLFCTSRSFTSGTPRLLRDEELTEQERRREAELYDELLACASGLSQTDIIVTGPGRLGRTAQLDMALSGRDGCQHRLC